MPAFKPLSWYLQQRQLQDLDVNSLTINGAEFLKIYFGMYCQLRLRM
jgi:hypothetical protein